jgi:hypothetical protein
MSCVFNVCGDVCVDLVFFDAPHGILPNTKWEFQITSTWLQSIFKQVNAASSRNDGVYVIMHKMSDSAIVLDAMKMGGLSQMIPFAWVKTGHHTQTPVSCLTSVFEVGTVGYKPNRTDVGWAGAKRDPRERRNVIEAKPVASFWKAADGEPINVCQKPPEIIQTFVNMHVPPGGNVLIIGFGSGAEICGALDCGVNVVGIDSDIRQFDAVKKVLVHKYEHEAKKEKALSKELGPPSSVASSPSTVSGGGANVPRGDDDDDEEVDTDYEDYPCQACTVVISSGMDRDTCLLGCGTLHTGCGVEIAGARYCRDTCEARYAGTFGSQRVLDWHNAETQEPDEKAQ